MCDRPYFDANRERTARHVWSEAPQYIQLSHRNMVEAQLPSNKKVLVLCDSGATKTLLSMSTVANSPYLSSIERQPIEKIKFKVGNGDYIEADFALTFTLVIQEHELELTGLVVPNLGGIDVVLGAKSLKEMECGLDFRSNCLTFRARSILLRAARDTMVKPGETKMLGLRGRLPRSLRHGEVLMWPCGFMRQYCPDRMLVRLNKGQTTILVQNDGQRPVRIKADQPVAAAESPH